MNAPATDRATGPPRTTSASPGRRRSVGIFERALYVWVVLELASGPLEPWRLSKVGYFDGYINFQRYLMMGFAGYIVGIERYTILKLLPRLYPVVALVALYFLSSFWSIGPGWSLERSANAATITLISIVFVTRLRPSQQLYILTIALSIGSWLSLLIGLFAPSVGQLSDLRVAGWNGIYAHPNFLGANVLLGLVCLSATLPSLVGRRSAWLIPALLTYPVGIFLAQRSGANTAKYAVVAVIATEGVVWLTRPWLPKISGRVALIGAGILVSGSGLLGIWASNHVTHLSTLSGRTTLWGNLARFLRQQWWNGYGYSQFFQGAKAYNVALAAWNIDVLPHAHNAFMEMMLDVGIIGVALLAAAFYLTARTAWRLTIAGSPRAYAARALWTFVLVANLTESYFITTTSIMWLVLIVLLSWGRLGNAQAPTQVDQGRRRAAATG